MGSYYKFDWTMFHMVLEDHNGEVVSITTRVNDLTDCGKYIARLTRLNGDLGRMYYRIIEREDIPNVGSSGKSVNVVAVYDRFEQL